MGMTLKLAENRTERILEQGVYEHAVQAVIIEDTVVDAIRGGALFIDLIISIRATGSSV